MRLHGSGDIGLLREDGRPARGHGVAAVEEIEVHGAVRQCECEVR